MKLADRVINLKPSATLAVSALALELKSQGKQILSLSIGEPDFNTPQHIAQAGIDAINANFTKYTAVQGIPELREAVADYFNLYGAGAKVENVMVSNGGKQGLFNILLAVLNPGDEAIIPAPYWVSYPAMVEIAGGIPVIVSAGAEKGFKVSVEDLEKARTAKTKICLINSPSNPTGAVYSAAELEEIVKWAVQHDILLVSDEIYDRLIYDGLKHASMAPWWAKYPENIAVANGVAKTFSMTGWRLGYMLAHPDLIKACNKLQGQSTSSICSISQKAALAALRGGFKEAEEMRQAFERRRNLVMDIISRWEDVICPFPQGAFYVFPDVHRLYGGKITDSASLSKALLEEAGVAVVPGEAFGDDRCIRLSYATSDDILHEALVKMEKVLYRK